MQNPYKYGSPEYKLRESIDNLSGALNEIVKWRDEVGKIMPMESLNSAGHGLSDYSGYYKYSAYPAGYANYSFSSFDKTNKNHIDDCVTKAKKWIKSIREESERLHALNLPAIENNKKLVDKIKNLFKNLGIPEVYSTYEFKTSRSSTKTETKHFAGYIKDLERCVKTSDGYEYQLKSLDQYESNLKKWQENCYKEIENNNVVKIKQDKELRKLAMAVELAKKYNLTYTTNEDLYKQVDEIEKENFIQKEYPDGSEIDHSSCDNCSHWVMGEHRCSCGNRRMYLSLDGNFFDGYIAYPQAD